MSKQIIWIEDDTSIIWPVVRPLEDRGYSLVVIESMRDAIDRLDELRNCDLILLDIILPALDEEWEKEHYIGLHLLRVLREQSVTTPVIVFTVVGNQEVRKELRELGVTSILSKPILPAKLEQAVLSVLEEKQP